MPENEFENKVSSEMQELKFKPSEQVWLRVEERIRKKNKRRVFIIIFLLAGLALLSYWQRSNLFGEKKNDIAKIVHGTSSGEKQKENSSKTSDETNSSSATKQNTETVKQEETNNTPDKTINNKLAHEEPVIDKKNIIVSSNEIYKPKNNKKNETKTKPGSEKTKIEQKPEIDVDVVAADSQ